MAGRPRLRGRLQGELPLSEPLLERLRAETRPAHARLEARLRLLDPGLDRAGYAWYLERFHGFYRPWERRMAALLAEPGFFDERRRLPAIAADLRALGLSAAEIAALPDCRDLPSFETRAAALGGLYVTEGSRLGGQVIARRVAGNLGLAPDAGIAFFASRGADPARLWRDFRAKLAREVAPDDHDAAIAAAQATFAAIEGWLS